MDPVFTTPPSKRWLENGLTVDPFLVEALQNPCHRLTSKLPSLIHLTNPNLDIIKFEVMEMPMNFVLLKPWLDVIKGVKFIVFEVMKIPMNMVLKLWLAEPVDL
ncbi:BnaCnng39670D [Brassica napus]|uniref:Uncharacterized protein n=2 Tax=Brassica TaxID=3705 RepID=A0A3P6F1J0_BRAOL|nr:unnamed protein product [Brassica napus]CDY62226.1 BnaCnng39670D [Brassica napus]VDD41084.1 unnamed protein product [Brassica oleracea]